MVVSSKGQVVIPQGIREKLGIGAKSKLLVYPYDDSLVMNVAWRLNSKTQDLGVLR